MPKLTRLRQPLRKTAKWGGIAASASLLALLLLSVLWSLYWCGQNGGMLVIAQGEVSVGWLDQSLRAHYPHDIRLFGPSFPITEYPPDLHVGNWEFTWGYNGRYGIGVPLWLPLLLTGTITALAWRADLLARRRARIGKCIACDYALDGLPPDAPCPECGKHSAAS